MSLPAEPLYLAFVWHMHQPYYRDLRTGETSLPWVRLHGVKDYLDMVLRLEAHPNVHATFNLVPSLLEQIESYLPPTQGTDRYLELARKPAGQLTADEQTFVLRNFFFANWDQMVKPHPRYHDLLAKRGYVVSEERLAQARGRFTEQEYRDLQVWFNLAWIDPSLREQDPRLVALAAKGGHFTEEEKVIVLNAHLELLERILPAYQQAQSRGQVEITVSPYYHPILPLLCHLESARVALPRVVLPATAFNHPEDARRQLEQAVRYYQARFSAPLKGLWPPEGSVSEEIIPLLAEQGIRWIATDEEILWRSLGEPRRPRLLYRPYRARQGRNEVVILFRDRTLSDLLGFAYARWEPQKAVEDFLQRLSRIRQELVDQPGPHLASIILDGENAWEQYPRDAEAFLNALYAVLNADPRFRAVTVSEFLEHVAPTQAWDLLPKLFPGSWIGANFATWIGHPDKNRAWECVAAAREALTTFLAQHPDQESAPRVQRAWQSLLAAEGSDWNWWFGDDHSSAQDDQFDALFRAHAANVYLFLGLPVPELLRRPIASRELKPRREPTGLMTPTIDGRETTYFEWFGAGLLASPLGAMHRAESPITAWLYGYDLQSFYCRIDGRWTAAAASDTPLRLVLTFGPQPRRIELDLSQHPCTARLLKQDARGGPWEPVGWLASVAVGTIVELGISFQSLGVQPGDSLFVSLSLEQGAQLLAQLPERESFHITLPAADFEARTWSV
ncbi:MAG: hypothetical protein HY597_04620 [Candidatus Omnitrophica bacterium]|nr:hypothetical protein [Candidatus Omnitrophota bacterium]